MRKRTGSLSCLLTASPSALMKRSNSARDMPSAMHNTTPSVCIVALVFSPHCGVSAIRAHAVGEAYPWISI